MVDPILPTPAPKVPKLVTGPTGKSGGLATSGKGVVPKLVTGPTGTGLKSGVAGAAPKKKTEDPWAPVLSFGQSVIDTLSTPLYGVEGTINALLKGKNPIEAIGAGAENATSWTKGKRPVTGAELLKTAGIESNFWSSLAADVLLDPLTYTPGVVFTAPLKAAGIAGKAAIKAGKLAAKGEIAAKAGAEGAKVAIPLSKAPLTSPKKWAGATFNTATVTPATEAQKSFLAKYANKQEATKAMLDKYSYNTVTIPTAGRATGQKVNDILASAFTAGKQAMVGTLLSEGAKRTLRKYAAKTNRIIKKTDQPALAQEAIKEAVIQAPKGVKAAEEAISPAEKAAPTPKTVMEQMQLPVLADTAPKTNTIREVANAAAGTSEAKTIKKILTAVETASKKAKVTAIADVDNLKKVKSILSDVRDSNVRAVAALDKDVFSRIKDAIVRKDGSSPFSFYRYFINSAVDAHAKLAKQVGGINLIDIDGKNYTLAQAAERFTDKQLSQQLMTQAVERFENTFLKFGTAKGLADIRYGELTDLLGKEWADAFKKTGALDPSVKTDKAALDQLINDLPAPGTATKKTYGGFDELIYGLKNGDIVDTDSLLAVIKALDPEAKLQTQVEKAMAKDAYNGLKDILIRNARSIDNQRKRLNELDPETMFKGTGVGMADTATVYLKGRTSGEIEALPDAILQSRQAVATEISKLDTRNVLSAATALSRAFDGSFERLRELGLDVIQMTKRGDAVARSKSGKMDAQSEAQRYLETNENFGTKLAGVVAGRGTYRSNKKFERALEKDIKFVPANRLDDFAAQMHIADKLLYTTVGTRMIVKQQAAKIITKGAPAHYLYLHVGDFADAALKFGDDFEKVAIKALFPGTGNKFDGISFTGLMDSIRMVVEGFEKNAMPTHGDLVGRLMSLGKSQEEKLSEGFKKALPKIAEDLATILEREDVIKYFMDAHATRLLGVTEDALQPAITMVEEIYQILHNAWKAANDQGITSTASRIDAVRQFFYEFAYTSHIFDQNYGPAGEAVFKAAAMMFVKDGEIAGIRILPTDAEEWGKFREAMNEYFKHTNSEAVAPAGREHLKFPTDATKAKYANELKRTMDDYESHMDLIPTLKTKQEVKDWVAQRKVLQMQLDKIRPRAWAAWQQTFHWVGGTKKWIKTEDYNHAFELEKAKKKQLTITLEGPVNLNEFTVDTPVTTKAPAMSKEQKKAAIDARNKAATKKAETESVGAKEDAAVSALDKKAEFEAQHPDDELAVAARLEQERLHDPIWQSNMPMFFFRNRWGTVKNPRVEEQKVGTLRQLGERLSATFGKGETQQIAARNESTMMFAIQTFAHGAGLIRDRYLGTLTQEQMRQGFRHALHDSTDIEDLPALGLDQLTIGLVQDLRQLMHPIREELRNTTIDNAILDRAFQHYGVTPDRGFMKASGTFDKTTMLHDLPFMEMPEGLTTELQREWNKRAEAFNAAEIDPFIMLANYAGAIQFAKTQQAIGLQFAAQFSHAAEGLTRAQAIERGYVRPKAIGLSNTSIDLTMGIPETALFHPYYAEQFAAMSRNWNSIYEKGMPGFLRIVLDLTGILKGTQTILRPGHHLTNIIGDTSIAIMRGARNPGTWARSMKIAYNHADEAIRAEWGKNKLDTTFKQITRRLEGVGGRKYVEGSEDAALTVAIGGKKVQYSNEELIKMLEDNGVLINNIFYDQYQGLYEAATDVAGKTLTEAEKTLNKEIQFNLQKATGKLSTGFQKITKPFGDAASYYGNIARTATALDVMEKGNFRSVQEMMNAVNDVVNRYHPTIQSLSGWERKYPRGIFTYYTWLRVAHNAMIDLALNHTSAMTFYSKAQYNKSEEQGFQPISIGQPWGDKTKTPGYINYSVYGPTQTGPRGEIVFKPSIPPLDVLDTWNIIYDPAYSADQNAVRNFGQVTQGVIGKNINILAQLPLEMITKTSPSTGKPTQVKDLQTLMDRMFSMTGQYTLAKGLGYTPPGKGPESANPLTQRDRDILIQNWLLGLKQADVNTPSNLKNAQSETSARLKAFMEQYKK